jgi:serine/threonine-protein kinase ATR
MGKIEKCVLRKILTGGVRPHTAEMAEKQEEANTLMANHFKKISAPAFYTALPQLISRITHPDKDTAIVVKNILRRVLTKYPAQAMWPLAWLRHSRQRERRGIGDEIFREAELLLQKGPNLRLHSLLVASKSLFLYLQKLAEYDVKDRNVTDVSVKPWKGEVDLAEFIPPVQAALSASLSIGDSSRSRDLFPRHVPRMRALSSNVRVMSSKARPKKLKAYVVSSDSAARSRAKKGDSLPVEDIGEIHFLVKREAKGDLRKDARVQDLNNVINRLMVSSSSGSNGASDRTRHIRLRTFEVTCLSEDTGILEWVPNTTSFRLLVGKAYNPQASPHSTRRRGARLASFGPTLRDNYEKKCQTMYFVSGDLKGAAKLFDELCLKPNPPLLYWWFVQAFHDPHAWYEARTRFTLSSAAWSAVGHVIGLGDRHSENILLDTESGECVHVDFDWYVPVRRSLSWFA